MEGLRGTILFEEECGPEKKLVNRMIDIADHLNVWLNEIIKNNSRTHGYVY